MSFFDNTKIAGWAFFIIGILMIISAIMDIWNGAGATGSLSDNAGYVVAGIGSLIAATSWVTTSGSSESRPSSSTCSH